MRLRWVRCEKCLRARYVIPSKDWPICHGEIMKPKTTLRLVEPKKVGLVATAILSACAALVLGVFVLCVGYVFYYSLFAMNP